MPPKTIKLSKKDDISAAIKRIKSSRDREIIFELEKDSLLLKNSNNLKLLKKTGEVMGKTVLIQTSDEMGQMLANKAGVLSKDSPVAIPKMPSRGLDVKSRFSDITARKISRPPTKPTTDDVILPPQTPQTRFATVKKVPDGPGTRMEINMKPGASKFSKIFILCLVFLVLAVFCLAVLLPKAEVTVYARSEPINRDMEMTVDKSAQAADSNSMIVPGIAVSKEVSQTKAFPTTGSKVSGNKASGTVTLYNFTENTLTLRAQTTTLTAGGQRFTFTKDITGIKPNGVPNEGIAIVAVDPGTASNLPSQTKFQITNAALGNRNVYALNPKALSGGTATSSIKVLSQQDIDSATSALVADVLLAAEDDLTESYSMKIRLLDSAVKKEILAKTTNKDVGAQGDTFNMTVIARVTGLAFREDDVTNVVVSKINEVLSSDKYLLNDAQKHYSAEFKSIDQVAGKGLLSVHFATIAAYKVDNTNLSKILAGKTEPEIKEILSSKPEVDNVEVKFWPEWFVHKAPRFNGKIKIDTVLEE